jgi:hypothetical protein
VGFFTLVGGDNGINTAVLIVSSLGITGIIEPAFLAHDTGLGIGKLICFLSSMSIPGLSCFAFLKGLL